MHRTKRLFCLSLSKAVDCLRACWSPLRAAFLPKPGASASESAPSLPSLPECPLFRKSHFYTPRAWEQGTVPELQHGLAQHCGQPSQLSSEKQLSDEKTEGHTVACNLHFSQKLCASNIVPLAQHKWQQGEDNGWAKGRRDGGTGSGPTEGRKEGLPPAQ